MPLQRGIRSVAPLAVEEEEAAEREGISVCGISLNEKKSTSVV
jgi:hypothetical protein